LQSAVSFALTALLGTLAGVSCIQQRKGFTEGRLETTCGDAIPVCDTRAACVLDDSVYVDASFPGGLKSLVRTETGDNKVVVRLLLEEMVSPGSELLVRAHSPGCGTFNERHLQDVDLFERAGDDRILQYEIDLEGEGDHLLEMFSDMGAEYLMTVTVEDTG
jgi:hypothetical protein